MSSKKRIIHVHQQKIRSNIGKTDEELEPPIIVRTYEGTNHGFEAEFKNGKVIYRPNDPLSCGARLWIETTETVILDGKEI